MWIKDKQKYKEHLLKIKNDKPKPLKTDELKCRCGLIIKQKYYKRHITGHSHTIMLMDFLNDSQSCIIINQEYREKVDPKIKEELNTKLEDIVE